MAKNLAAALCMAIIALGACSTNTVGAPSEGDEKVLQVYLATECPSTPPPSGAQANAGIVTTLLTFGIDSALDALGSALAEAAKADKEGVARTASAASYLYIASDDAETKALLMQCVVIAIAPSGPKNWCNAGPLVSTKACVSADGKSRVSQLLAPVARAPAPAGKGEITFYAEVQLHPSTDQRGLLPIPVLLYYPSSVNSGVRKFDNKDKRDLSVTVTGSTPANETGMTALHVYLKGITPSATLIERQGDAPHEILDKAIGRSWLAVAKPPELKGISLSDDRRVFPVNLSVEVREVGAPNVFLQALAAAFAKSKDAVAQQLKAKLPENVAGAEAKGQSDALDAKGKYATAIAAAYKALSEASAACAGPSAADPNKDRSLVFQKMYSLSAAIAEVRKLEAQSGAAKQSFGFEDGAIDSPKGTALAVCGAIKS